MIEVLQDLIWDIGGMLFTISLFLFVIAWLLNWGINRLCGYHKKEFRKNLYYWIRHKKEINEIIDKRKNDKR